MSYIGRGVDAISNVEKLDNITFNGGTTYALTKSSAAFTPVGANNILVSIDGVIQQGNFSVSTTNIVFDWSPTSSNTCNFILHYGTGVLNVPADGAVSTAKIADDAVTLAKMAGLARGKIIYGDASGNPAALTVGSNTQVLKSDGTDISWGTDSGGAALTGSTDNTVVTVTGANAIQGEARLLFDGQNLSITDGGTGAEGKLNFGDAADADVGRINYNHATNYMTLFTNGSEAVRITSAGKVGIGDSDPKGIIHAKSATSGQNPHANADEGIFEGSAHSGISILSGNSSYGRVMFGDDGLNDIGALAYNHSDNSMGFTVNNAEQMKIDSIGAVTKPNQPAFHVTPSSDVTNPSSGDTIAWGNEKFDQNGDFASNTFTAPVTGRYHFDVHCGLNGVLASTDWMKVNLVTSNDTFNIVVEDVNKRFSDDANNTQTFNGSLLCTMDANDTCSITVEYAGGAALDFASGVNYMNFSGYLVC